MKSAPFFCMFLLVGLMVALGCRKDAEPAAEPAVAQPQATRPPSNPDEVVASVNGKPYVRKDMEAVVDALLNSQNIPAEQRDEARRYFEQRAVYSFVMKNLLLDEAKKLNIATTHDDRTNQIARMSEALKAQNKTVEEFFKESPLGETVARQEFEDGLLIDKLLQSQVLDAIKIAPEEVKGAIAEIEQRNAELLERNQNLSATNAAQRAKILAIQKQLNDGADFAALARENSDCPSGQQGGDLGEFTRGQMVKPFEDAAFSQELNVVGNIVDTPFGYHLIKVTAKSPAQEASGDQPAKPETVTASHILVRTEQAQQPQRIPETAEIEEHLKRQKTQEAVQAYLETLKSAATIETIFPDMPL